MASKKSNSKSGAESIKTLELKWEESMKEFQNRLDEAQANSNVCQLAEEFRCFKDTMLSALNDLKSQIASVVQITDDIDCRSRRKYILLRGVQEEDNEDPVSIATTLLSSQMKVTQMQSSHIKACYRLGQPNKKDHPRPLLIKFCDLSVRSSVWKNKKALKGTGISVAEFLTAKRREIFVAARKMYGMHSCWTQDGNIYLKLSNGCKMKLTSLDQVKVRLDGAQDNPKGSSSFKTKGKAQ